MTAGVGVFLIVVGAILTWAVEFDISGFDIQNVGYIFLAAGVVVLLASLFLSARGRRSTATRSTVADTPNGPVVTEQTTEARTNNTLP